MALDHDIDGHGHPYNVVETSPDGKYLRYDVQLGRGAFREMYKAFDTEDAIEVAWNTVSIGASPQEREKLRLQVSILKSLDHPNIIAFHNSWVDPATESVVFITELMASGTLKQYIHRTQKISLKVIKKWCRQILTALKYMHEREPPVIHRDLKCDNIFINGNSADVKIGDLGLATFMPRSYPQSVIGTPEFMAPELYDDNYNEKVDIWSFGMCVLEMITREYPYIECQNAAQIFKKVSAGKLPAALDRITDPEVRAFISSCLCSVSVRKSAAELLMDPFLRNDEAAGGEGQPGAGAVDTLLAKLSHRYLQSASSSVGPSQPLPSLHPRPGPSESSQSHNADPTTAKAEWQAAAVPVSVRLKKLCASKDSERTACEEAAPAPAIEEHVRRADGEEAASSELLEGLITRAVQEDIDDTIYHTAPSSPFSSSPKTSEIVRAHPAPSTSAPTDMPPPQRVARPQYDLPPPPTTSKPRVRTESLAFMPSPMNPSQRAAGYHYADRTMQVVDVDESPILRHVFISYRRSGGDDLAHLLYRELRRRYYSVFLDVKQLSVGQFDEDLKSNLLASCCVVLVCTAARDEAGRLVSCLDRCKGDDAGNDWVHKEIAAAIAAGMPIIPVFKEPFRFPAASELPEDMRAVLSMNGVKWDHELNDGSLNKLCMFVQRACERRCAEKGVPLRSLALLPSEVEESPHKAERTKKKLDEALATIARLEAENSALSNLLKEFERIRHDRELKSTASYLPRREQTGDLILGRGGAGGACHLAQPKSGSELASNSRMMGAGELAEAQARLEADTSALVFKMESMKRELEGARMTIASLNSDNCVLENDVSQLVSCLASTAPEKISSLRLQSWAAFRTSMPPPPPANAPPYMVQGTQGDPNSVEELTENFKKALGIP